MVLSACETGLGEVKADDDERNLRHDGYHGWGETWCFVPGLRSIRLGRRALPGRGGRPRPVLCEGCTSDAPRSRGINQSP
ncbi:MAG: hypothetical protein AB1641_03865 [Thermodesulfobacteriota bacterium]